MEVLRDDSDAWDVNHPRTEAGTYALTKEDLEGKSVKHVARAKV